jgi:dipeptide/tripeptide permease
MEHPLIEGVQFRQLRLLSTAPVWAIVINNFCFHYIVYVLMAWLPTYFEKALKMDMSQAAFMNQLPYLVMFVFSNVGGIIADRLIGRMVRYLIDVSTIN